MVVSDGSEDGTDAIVRQFAGRGITLFRVEGRVGKTEARNRAVVAARGEIIVFSDATTAYDPQVIRKMVRNFHDPTVGAVSGRYEYVKSGASSIGLANILYWKYENSVKYSQSRIMTLTGMSGCINSFRRALYQPLPSHIIEDLVEPLTILEKGYRIIFEPEALAYEVTTDSPQQEFSMRVRVITQGITGLLFMRRLFNPFRHFFPAFQLVSHKVLRWCIPFFLLGMLVANIFLVTKGTLYLAAAVLQSLFYALALLGLLLQRTGMRSKLLSVPVYFCTLNLAALVSWYRVLRGATIPRWETVR
jgi:cellulose synthase/poly-beta-1,6-N-acetylglucosamine synthase-like glycosyltransferase